MLNVEDNSVKYDIFINVGVLTKNNSHKTVLTSIIEFVYLTKQK
uniref:Uncharacterized protein n=1 Tax=Rhizophora mucronata TaxID=61149 RepID=A0A2P2PDA0_RHIMU